MGFFTSRLFKAIELIGLLTIVGLEATLRVKEHKRLVESINRQDEIFKETIEAKADECIKISGDAVKTADEAVDILKAVREETKGVA